MRKFITSIHDTTVPQPYAEYVGQRSDKIGEVLTGLMPNQRIVLCSRHITQQELPPNTTALIYGVVVDDPSLGHKDTLYKLNTADTFDVTGSGIATDCLTCLEEYCAAQFGLGNRVRIKEPTASDSNGQKIVSSLEGLHRDVGTLGITNNLVAMPNLAKIFERISIGVINLGKFGTFAYFGRENTTTHNDRECYGGTEIALFRQDDEETKGLALGALEIDPDSAKQGLGALERYGKVVRHLGRASVDYIVGVTDNGDQFRGVIDLTARVGGVTPAEVLAIETLIGGSADGGRVALAQSILTYDPDPTTEPDGTMFVKSKGLRITAEVTGAL